MQSTICLFEFIRLVKALLKLYILLIKYIYYKSNDYLKKSPVYGHFRKTAA